MWTLRTVNVHIYETCPFFLLSLIDFQGHMSKNKSLILGVCEGKRLIVEYMRDKSFSFFFFFDKLVTKGLGGPTTISKENEKSRLLV